MMRCSSSLDKMDKIGMEGVAGRTCRRWDIAKDCVDTIPGAVPDEIAGGYRRNPLSERKAGVIT